MATDPLDLDDDLATVVARARRRMFAAGTHKAPVAGVYQSPFGPEEQEVVGRLLRDGIYHRAVAAVVATDPDLADQ